MRRGRVAGARRARTAIGLGLLCLVATLPGHAQEAESPAAAQAAPPPARPRAAAAPKAAETPAPSEFAWIRGEVRVNYRVSPTPNATPLGIVTTGDRVGILERRSGWARVLIGDDGVGWLPENLLDTTPPPLEHIAQLEAQIADLRAQLEAAEQEANGLRDQVAQLSGKDAEREEAMRRLSEENRDLRAGERWPYLVTGASILGIGLVVGRFLRGASSRRSYSRIR
ncbi:MAG: hypothetical protein DCC71_03030 [Proteobacteria bacterium]|nr:MAG: hypothetical protein DCC71_03030 [Pseudomonadota bacterium]